MLLVLISDGIVINLEDSNNKIQTQVFYLQGTNWKHLLVSVKGFVFNLIK